jgi:transglutaminase/protease-like cytokinesis protein 3
MEALHHSFKEFYEVDEPNSLPFNQTPERIGEVSGYIAIPIKRNARQSILNEETPIKQFVNELLHKSNESKPKNIVGASSSTYLCFERALYSHIQEVTKQDLEKVDKILREHERILNLDDYYTNDASLKPNPVSLNMKQDQMILSHFPSDAQWNTLNQLRIHAGSPERTNAGISKLAM